MPRTSSILGQMVSMSFKAPQLVSWSKFMTIVILIQKVSIVWLIALIWQHRPFQVCYWWCNLKFSYKPCIFILQIYLRSICNSQSWLNSWKQRKTRFFKMWKQDGFWCSTLLNVLCWSKWPWIAQQTNKPSWIFGFFLNFA